MKVKRIYAVNFRNYKECCLKLLQWSISFMGKMLRKNKSFRSDVLCCLWNVTSYCPEDDMQRLDTNQLAVGINFEDLHGVNDVKIKRQQLDGKNKKELFLNDVKVRPKEHYGTLNMVMFSPEDLQLIKGEPALRRRFLICRSHRLIKLIMIC